MLKTFYLLILYFRDADSYMIIALLFILLALEIIPRQLCDNAGFDATNILNKLRQKHAQGNLWYGVDILNEDIRIIMR